MKTTNNINIISNDVDICEWLPRFDISAESDYSLADYFTKTTYFNEILKEKTWLVLGRKGSGKTAIVQYLKSRTNLDDTNGYKVIPLDFNSYPWNSHLKYVDKAYANKSAYEESWRYLFAVTLMKQLINDLGDETVNDDRELIEANKFIEKMCGDNAPITNIMKQDSKRLSSIAFQAFSVGGSIGLTSEKNSGTEYDLSNVSVITKISNHFFSLIEQHIGKRKYLITLDRLDEEWTEEEKEKYKQILAGLIAESYSFNNKFNSKKNSIKICLFLRTEIYNDLSFNDKNKIAEDRAIEIKWSGNALDEMFFNRIKFFLNKWNEDHPDHLVVIQEKSFANDNSQSSRIFDQISVRHKISTFRQILRSSFYRPRDIITYMNKVRDAHRNDVQKSSLYTSKDLRNANPEYSNSMMNELKDEFGPLKGRDYLESLMTTLTTISKQGFTLGAFLEVYSGNEADAKDDLRFLFDISALGQKVANNYLYRFDDPHLEINYGKYFYVNSALKASLHLVEGLKESCVTVNSTLTDRTETS